MKDIWGDKGATNIKIPTLIDDYNNWMGGIDVADQRILYYHPSKVVCVRNWIPIFIRFLIPNNASIIHCTNTMKDVLSQKAFTQEIVWWIMSQSRNNIIVSSKQAPKPKVPEAKSAINRKRKKALSNPSTISSC